ncbi:MAG: LysM peptidoglycan-binding domain-containing protein [Dorea sp.]
MERQFPKNVKQIGNVCDEPKIYVEDYVDTYLNQLKEKAVLEPMGVVLAGEIVNQDKQAVVYISGAIQIKEMEINGTDIAVQDEVWEQVKTEKEEYFPESAIVGWCLIETGHPMGLNRGVNKMHCNIFSEENTVFIWRDAVDNDEMFYAYKYGELMQMGGHYIYYEKNPAMQNYMINTRKMNGVTPSEMVEDRAAKNFRSTIREKMEYKEQRQSSRFSYAMSVFLVVVVLAIGISTMNNFDKMEAVQDSLESLSQAVGQSKSEVAEIEEPVSGQALTEKEETVQASSGTVPEVSTIQEQLSEEDYYMVQKGDTLDSISRKLYGSTSYVEAICKMNGLEDGNLIFIGQKLLLP